MSGESRSRPHAVGAACAAFLLIVLHIGTALALIDGDYLLNHESNSLLNQIYEMQPSAFEPNGYVTEVIKAYGAVNPDFTEDLIELVEWCSWPNASIMILDTHRWGYCAQGANTASQNSPYVLVSYKLFTSNVTLRDATISLPAPYNEPVSVKPQVIESDPAVYDPDTRSRLDEDTNFVQTVTNDSVAFWAIFGSLVGVVVVVAIALAVIRCHRDRQQRVRNTNVVRGTMHQYHHERTSFFQSFLALGKSSGGTSKRKHGGKKGRKYGAQDPDDVRNRYDIGGGFDESEAAHASAVGGAASATASQPVTTRASAYWPGADAGRETGDNDSDREMERRDSGKKYY